MSIVDLPPTLLQSNLRLFVRMTILQERESSCRNYLMLALKQYSFLGTQNGIMVP